MSRSVFISLIDVVAFVGFVFLTTTGVLLHFMLPPGSGRWSEVWGMSRHQWGDVHFWVSVVFFGVLAVHLLLHWRFVVTLFKGRMKEGARLRVALGLVGVITILVLALAPLLGGVDARTDVSGGHRYGIVNQPAAPDRPSD